MLVLTLTLPPSANHCWSNAPGKGRVKTAAYKAWINIAGWEIKAQAPGAPIIKVPYSLRILVSADRYDLDNVAKPLGDILKTMRLVEDDRLMSRLLIERHEGPCGVRLELEAIEPLKGAQ